ncbi:MAG: hypothetical protein GWN00_00610 [Aliifodinibius sp.]|nr:winged helix-turn-helix transcriptional regulator [Fodinibius sp.]NIW96689.1 hypothetical protein [Phycisphaerae bacterium]NIY23366.1 hypothetical protein [Fodinibius sp.]
MKVKADKLFKVLNRIRAEMGGEYTPQQLEILLLCYVRPGITQTEISQILDMPQASVSRNCLKLGKKAVKNPQGRFKVVGAGLIQTRQDEVYDSRRYACWLTEDGTALVEKVLTVSD